MRVDLPRTKAGHTNIHAKHIHVEKSMNRRIDDRSVKASDLFA